MRTKTHTIKTKGKCEDGKSVVTAVGKREAKFGGGGRENKGVKAFGSSTNDDRRVDAGEIAEAGDAARTKKMNSDLHGHVLVIDRGKERMMFLDHGDAVGGAKRAQTNVSP